MLAGTGAADAGTDAAVPSGAASAESVSPFLAKVVTPLKPFLLVASDPAGKHQNESHVDMCAPSPAGSDVTFALVHLTS